MAQKILFIEDESALQRAVAHMLSEEGFQMLSALDGETGLKIAKEEKPNLILLDLILPKKDGFAVMDELAKDHETAGIPIIILSNLENSNDVDRALKLGAKTYLVKTNYELGEVVQKIKQVLQ